MYKDVPTTNINSIINDYFVKLNQFIVACSIKTENNFFWRITLYNSNAILILFVLQLMYRTFSMAD